MTTIWDTKFIRIAVQHGECWVEEMSVKDLRWENRGYPSFVRAVLHAILQENVYDDSDPQAAFQGGPWVWYLPVSKVHFRSPSGLTSPERCDAHPAFEVSREHIVVGDVRIAWAELGEGWSGDYHPDDPEDEELLRFDVYRRRSQVDPVFGEWTPVEDGSYCTRLPVSATGTERTLALLLLMAELYEPVSSGRSVKKLAEQLSWIDRDWLV